MLKITAHLLDGFIHAPHNNGINLDALLTWAHAKINDLPKNTEPVLGIPLDVMFTTKKGLPVFACSRMFIGKHENPQLYRHKRNKLKREILCDKPLSKIEMATGQYKDSRISHSATIPFSKTVEWFAKGCAADIEILLQQITHIGKNRAVYGRVFKWDITEVDDFDLTPHIVIPAECMQSDRPTRLQTFTPPYWYKRNQEICYVAV